MQRREKQIKLYRTERLQMSICSNETSTVKCRTEMTQMPICTGEVCKVKYTELKYCNCHYAETREAKYNTELK